MSEDEAQSSRVELDARERIDEARSEAAALIAQQPAPDRHGGSEAEAKIAESVRRAEQDAGVGERLEEVAEQAEEGLAELRGELYGRRGPDPEERAS